MNKKIEKKNILILLITLISLGFFLIQGCSDDPVTTSSESENLDLSFTADTDTTDLSGILTIDTVKLLIKDIKLNVSGNDNDSLNFKTGPYVLYSNLNSSVNLIGSGFIPSGTYDKVRFMVHKLNDNEAPPDPEFADSAGRYSVIVKGTYLGIPFVYKSSKSAHQKLTFQNNLIVSVSGKTNITLRVSPYIWFIKNGLYLDPSNSANTNDIDNNIKNNINNNFKIFVDKDKNGMPDQ